MSPARNKQRRVREAAPRYDVELSQRLLLDTHTWIWWSSGARQLGPWTRELIRKAAEVHFSVASAWEIAIKSGNRRLSLPPEMNIPQDLASDGFRVLDVTLDHALGVQSLPRHHGDPFDRLLVSQALAEGLTIVTSDRNIARYPVPVLPAGR